MRFYCGVYVCVSVYVCECIERIVASVLSILSILSR